MAYGVWPCSVSNHTGSRCLSGYGERHRQLVVGRDMMPERYLITLLTLPMLFCSASYAGTAVLNFTVSATIVNGCAFGSSVTSPTTNLGTINFGSIASVPSNLDMVSTTGAGSVVVTCTPGATPTISMDYGINGGSATQ